MKRRYFSTCSTALFLHKRNQLDVLGHCLAIRTYYDEWRFDCPSAIYHKEFAVGGCHMVLSSMGGAYLYYGKPHFVEYNFFYIYSVINSIISSSIGPANFFGGSPPTTTLSRGFHYILYICTLCCSLASSSLTNKDKPKSDNSEAFKSGSHHLCLY